MPSMGRGWPTLRLGQWGGDVIGIFTFAGTVGGRKAPCKRIKTMTPAMADNNRPKAKDLMKCFALLLAMNVSLFLIVILNFLFL